MSKHAWVYIWTVLLMGAVLSGVALSGLAPSTSQWQTFLALMVLATFAQLFEAEAPKRQSYYPHLVFFFAGMLLLPPSFFVLLVAIPHLVEWAKKRLEKSPLLRAWYIQPFNMATHIIAGSAARWLLTALNADVAMVLSPSSVLAVIIAALTYVALNHLLVGLALVLARGVSWSESGILEIENLLTDFVMLCLGSVVAVLWQLNPWLSLLALSPLALIYRALMVPQLKEQARVDAKTGLWNARHFVELFTAEMERAKRFDRPLALIMTDLDLLRNINNTYGHLAGDAVLAGVGQIIRENIRDYDIAGRFGGEEFCIALPETDLAEARSLAERMRKAVAAASFEVQTSPTPIGATISLGVACFPSNAATPIDLIHAADVAVYQAKLKGRNCLVCASDVPHFVKLERALVDDRLTAPYAAAFATRPEPAGGGPRPDTDASALPVKGEGPASSATVVRSYPKALVWLFVGGVIAAGAVLTVLGLVSGPQPDLVAIGLLTLVAVIAEMFQINVYEASTISVSMAINFAAALIAGIPGAACVSAAIVFVHYFRMRPFLYKTAFNWATHVLASLAPVLAMIALAIPLQVSNLLLLAIPLPIAALAYYIIETGLISIAISLSKGVSPIITWREQFQWLAGHYLVLGIMGLFLGVAYTILGPASAIVFTLPVLMMHYAQKQYVERTEDSVRELRRMNQELTLANCEVVQASQAIRQLNEELFMTLAKITDARDAYVFGHTVQVTNYAIALANELNLPAERVEQVRQAAFLHDIGKIGIPEHVIQKPGKLTDKQYERMKTHATLGAEFLETCHGLRHLTPFVRHHHEWWDGRGYPDGLRGEQIPLEARILALCDTVEAMASDRPYRRAMSLGEILSELKRCAGTQFDPVVIEAFVRVAERDGDHLIVNSAQEVERNHVGNGDPAHHSNGWFVFQQVARSSCPAV
ncbi:MAG: diguanylate cyclase [Anaerolineales bacterium]|nr:diguanylate cyclase [Anaerolineales bacterium]